QLAVGNVQAETALRVRFDHVGEFPGNRVRRNRLLQAANPLRRQHALENAAKNAARPDIDIEQGERVARALLHDPHGDVVDADHLAPGDVDDLLIQQVAPDAQHILVVVIRDEQFVAQVDSAFQADGTDLVVAQGEPRIASAAKQDAIDAGSVDQGDQGRVFHTSDAAALKVVDRHRK